MKNAAAMHVHLWISQLEHPRFISLAGRPAGGAVRGARGAVRVWRHLVAEK